MNAILARQDLWNPVAREEAARDFDPRVVSAFYYNLDPSAYDPWSIRDGVIPLPGQDLGYVRVLLVGTTGAGKTTLIRQLIGTDPLRDRFPSTSAAKTTVADSEIVLNSAAEFRVVVTFLQKETVQLYVEECVTATVLASINNRTPQDLVKYLLEHSGQRFRLSYLLGTLDTGVSRESIAAGEEVGPNNVDMFAEFDREDPSEAEIVDAVDAGDGEVKVEERIQLQEKLNGYLDRIISLAGLEKDGIEQTLGVRFENATRDERETLEELLEDNLRNNNAFHQVVDEIMDDIESRFELLSDGVVERGSGWPTNWSYSCAARYKSEFIRIVNRFSSNYAPNYGRLLTPIVEGIRVSGPFRPNWTGDRSTRLVLLDGEGLGHTPESAMSLSSKVTRRFDFADAVVLVDNAAQPMQASPILLLRSLAARGQEDKLIVSFTHFEDVIGDNLPTFVARKNHVLRSLDSAVTSVGAALGKSAENALRRVTNANVVFLSGIDKTISAETDGKEQRLSRKQLDVLLDMLDKKIISLPIATIAPVYDDANIVLNIQLATRALNQEWQARVGLIQNPNISKDHWARIKALARHVGELGEDEYLYLRPVADMGRHLNEHLSRFLSEPVGWEPTQPDEDEQMRSAINLITRPLARRLDELARTRVLREHLTDWQAAFSRRGPGSTFVRAHDVAAIFNQAAPVPGEVASLEATGFARLLRQILREVIADNGGRLYQDRPQG